MTFNEKNIKIPTSDDVCSFSPSFSLLFILSFVQSLDKCVGSSSTVHRNASGRRFTARSFHSVYTVVREAERLELIFNVRKNEIQDRARNQE